MNSIQTKIAGLMLLLAASCVTGSALADDNHVTLPPSEQQIQKLIELLGDPSFTVRQNANRKLIDAGIAALPQLRRAADHPDRELGYRVQRLIEFMDRVTLRQQIDAFLEADDPAKFGMPCWPEYTDLMNGESAGRLVFADMLRQEMSLLKKFDSDANTDYAALIQERLGEIQQKLKVDTQTLDIGSVCAICFCLCRREIKLDTNHQNMLVSITTLSQVKTAVDGGERKDAIRRLISLAIVDNDNFSDALALNCGLNLAVPGVVSRAKRIVEEEDGSISLRQQALLTIGQLGNLKDVEFLEKRFDDPAALMLFRGGEYKPTLGDIAVLAAINIRFSGKNRDDFGMDPKEMFKSAEKRQQVREKYAKLRTAETAKEKPVKQED